MPQLNQCVEVRKLLVYVACTTFPVRRTQIQAQDLPGAAVVGNDAQRAKLTRRHHRRRINDVNLASRAYELVHCDPTAPDAQIARFARPFPCLPARHHAPDRDAETVVGCLAAEVADGVVTLKEAAHMCIVLFNGGHETTTNLMTVGLHALFDAPERLDVTGRPNPHIAF